MSIFLYAVIWTAYSVWLRLFCWNRDGLTAGLLAVQKGSYSLCFLHSRFSRQTLSRVSVFHRCFLSWSSPNVVHPRKVSSPSHASSSVPECVWTGSPRLTRLKAGSAVRLFKHPTPESFIRSTDIMWFYAIQYTMRIQILLIRHMRTHTDTHPLTESKLLSDWK